MDRNVEAVRQRLAKRAEAGLKKYGVTTEREDLTLIEWLQHLQDELMDAAVYVERLKGDVKTTAPAPAEASSDADVQSRPGGGGGLENLR